MPLESILMVHGLKLFMDKELLTCLRNRLSLILTSSTSRFVNTIAAVREKATAHCNTVLTLIQGVPGFNSTLTRLSSLSSVPLS